MYPHVGKAFIPIRRSSCAAEEIYRKIAKFCRSADVEGFSKSIDFEDGGALIQSTKDGLILHVFAWDILTFYGIRALIEGGLPKVIFRSVKSVEWLPQKNASPQPHRHDKGTLSRRSRCGTAGKVLEAASSCATATTS